MGDEAVEEEVGISGCKECTGCTFVLYLMISLESSEKDSKEKDTVRLLMVMFSSKLLLFGDCAPDSHSRSVTFSANRSDSSSFLDSAHRNAEFLAFSSLSSSSECISNFLDSDSILGGGDSSYSPSLYSAVDIAAGSEPLS